MSALLALALLAAPEWFRAVQYAAGSADLRGCAECRTTIAATATPMAAPQRRPTCHLIRGPANRCKT